MIKVMINSCFCFVHCNSSSDVIAFAFLEELTTLYFNSNTLCSTFRLSFSIDVILTYESDDCLANLISIPFHVACNF